MKEYLKKWESHDSPKPCNDTEFTSKFLDFIKSKPCDHWEFDGENHYCGYTAIVYEDNPDYCMGRTLGFEFAYDKDFVKVFTANHGGFWVPEYINLSGNDAKEILEVVREKLVEWAGFNNA